MDWDALREELEYEWALGHDAGAYYIRRNRRAIRAAIFETGWVAFYLIGIGSADHIAIGARFIFS